MRFYRLNPDHSYTKCENLEEADNSLQSKSHIVKKTWINETEVSTVFLSLDHSLFGDIPILFETMVFGPLDSNQTIQERYSTWDEAVEGHDKIVERLREL